MSHGQSPSSTGNFSGRGPETLERIYQQLNLKISDLTDENRIQKVALTELASINSALLARCKALEIENANLWNEVFKFKGSIFPSEITDIFIDFLHDDRKSLTTCGLVCKNWLTTSRYHLFSSISFKESISKRHSDLRDLMNHPLCTFKPSVRRVTLEKALQNVDDTWLTSVLPHFTQLTAVTTLRLVNFNQETASPNDWEQFWSNKTFFDGIKKLYILKSDIILDTQFLVQNFPNLISLHHATNRDVEPFLDPSHNISPEQHILHPFADLLSTPFPKAWRKVTLTFPTSTVRFGVKDWFNMQKTGSGFVHLNLCQVREEDLLVLSECFRFLGHSLYMLNIHFLNERSQVTFNCLNILSRNTRLQYINIFGPFYYDVKRNQYLQSLQNAPDLVKSIPGHALKHICITFVIGDFSSIGAPLLPESMREGSCSLIDGILTPPSCSDDRGISGSFRFPRLEEVTFNIYTAKSDYAIQVTGDLMERTEAMLQEHFPRLYDSGMLKCKTNVD